MNEDDLDYMVCAEDAQNIRTERVMDAAFRLCFGMPNLTPTRRAKIWSHLSPFLQEVLSEGATDWDGGPVYVCDRFDEFATYSEYKIQNGLEHRFYQTCSYIARTAIDIGSGFPGGTFGLSIGELKTLYGGELPDWWSHGWLDKDNRPVDLNAVDESVVLMI